MLERESYNSENLLNAQPSGEVINIEKRHSSSLYSTDSSEENIDQDKVVATLEDFKAEYTNVANILPQDCYPLRKKDKFDIIKFTIKVNAVYTYQWEVYRKPKDVKKNFAEVLNELTKNFMTPVGEKLDIFTQVASWPEDTFQSHIQDIENYYKILFKDYKIYNILIFKEFFNISVGSFNQYNSGNKPFEGFCYKKADPKCKSNSQTGKNVYFFDNDLKVKKEGRDIIKITNISRNLILKFKTVLKIYYQITHIRHTQMRKKEILLIGLQMDKTIIKI